jgi:hypothetical protein
MGIYIIKSLYSNWIKIGHHKITNRRPSVYYRYINRGFYSVIHPKEIYNKLSFSDLKLLYWFHNLDIIHEKNIHNKLKINYENIGEWYKYEDLNTILNIIENDYGGINKMPQLEELEIAKKWAFKKLNS